MFRRAARCVRIVRIDVVVLVRLSLPFARRVPMPPGAGISLFTRAICAANRFGNMA